jgi:hypothetical protein
MFDRLGIKDVLTVSTAHAKAVASEASYTQHPCLSTDGGTRVCVKGDGNGPEVG